MMKKEEIKDLYFYIPVVFGQPRYPGGEIRKAIKNNITVTTRARIPTEKKYAISFLSLTSGPASE